MATMEESMEKIAMGMEKLGSSMESIYIMMAQDMDERKKKDEEYKLHQTESKDTVESNAKNALLTLYKVRLTQIIDQLNKKEISLDDGIDKVKKLKDQTFKAMNDVDIVIEDE